jgi:hypothetical protein
MPDELDLSRYELALAALIDAAEWTEATSKLAKLHSTQERARIALEYRRKELDSLYERALAPDTGYEEITQVASIIGEWGCAAAEKFYPQIDGLRQKLAASAHDMSPEIRRARQESVQIAKGWLALYRDLHDKLLKLAAERRPDSVVLRTRPVEEKIDHAELSREFMERFPKIRAALAK